MLIKHSFNNFLSILVLILLFLLNAQVGQPTQTSVSISEVMYGDVNNKHVTPIGLASITVHESARLCEKQKEEYRCIQ